MADEVFYTDPNVVKEIAKLTKKDFYYLGLGEEIPSGADLNDYKTPGVYVIPSAAVSTLSNNPFAGQGEPVLTLLVRDNVGGGNVTQELSMLNAGITYYRFYQSWVSTWDTWYCNSGTDAPIAEGTVDVPGARWDYIKWAGGMAHLSMTTTMSASDIVFAEYNHIHVSYPFQLTSVTGGGGFVSVEASAGCTLNHVHAYGDSVEAYVRPIVGSGVVTICLSIWGRWK